MLQEMEFALNEMKENFTNVSMQNTSESFMKELDYSSDLKRVEKIVAIVVPIFFGMIGILGLVGNSLVVIVVAANPGMRSTTNILIINLAVADLLFVIFCIPFTATDFVLPYWPFGNIWCKMVQYLIIVTAYASVYTLVLMSLD
ncbi:allatostatin-A receptor-like, partial [Lasioglossum baleicum]|uniref:allatostatin-A receptor-like n=1 Tax=Lasioglossum baleicum TaxID=434251 RepID=UPI003FCC9764